MKLEVVIPIFNEQENIEELSRRLAEACDAVEELEWSIIYVNDGSRDQSEEMMLALHQKDPRFRIVNLSRNFGHQAAVTAGLSLCEGDAVVLMDGDLQDPPELIPELVESWRQGGQVVRAVRKSRKETGVRRLFLEIFHTFFGFVSDFPVHSRTGVFGLLDRRAVQELCLLKEKNRFIPGLRSWIGFDQRVVLYDRDQRAAGEPKQNFKRLFRYAMDGLFSFSYKPLRLLTWSGFLISSAGFFIASFFVFRRLFGFEIAFTGFTTLVTLMLFLGGVQLIGIGILGEYLGRVYDEVKRRPMFIIDQLVGFEHDEESPSG